MPTQLGPLFFDLLGTELTSEEKELLAHPLVGGVILFSRNFTSPEQISDLCRQIRLARSSILIGVDQEGGRVQRFKESFTRLPPMGVFGEFFQEKEADAHEITQQTAWLMASEILSVGLDFSFTPVLDLDKKLNTVVGDRAFSNNPVIVTTLADSWIKGLTMAGMAAIGKHFPGHGSVKDDSHLSLPVDSRSFDEIDQEDLIPFKKLISQGMRGVMSSHIVFPEIDSLPVTFSKAWLKGVLREKLKFEGVLFSDDLSMKATDVVGDYLIRFKLAIDAGCDYVLVCNNRAKVIEILDNVKQRLLVPDEKMKAMRGNFSYSWKELISSKKWKSVNTVLHKINDKELF